MVRVENEPGIGHAHLLEMQGEAGFVFQKGVQLHADARHMNPTEFTSSTISKGDGGWIMMRCED
eukprot:scaffold16668_cov119-Isochrysis_galbana.AAC.4